MENGGDVEGRVELHGIVVAAKREAHRHKPKSKVWVWAFLSSSGFAY